jgi:citrate lyase beta subunit
MAALPEVGGRAAGMGDTEPVRLSPDTYAELDRALAPVDAALRQRYPGPARGRQPVHTVYVPADKVHSGLVAEWGELALAAVEWHPPLPYAEELHGRVTAKLAREPIEDLRIDFEDGYGVRSDEEEDAAVRAAAAPLADRPPFFGIRIKSLEEATRRRAVRTLDLFLDALGSADFVVTLPKVSAVEQVDAMVLLCGQLERAYRLPDGALRFEVQVETPPAVLGADGAATVARMVHAAQGRCVGLHYGTYDYSAACGIAAAYQSMEHPAADYAKAVMQVAAAGTGVHVSDGSTNVLPVGETDAVQAAWRLHARLVQRSLERGFYQGWDLHPAQLPTRYATTYAFFRSGSAVAVDRLSAYLQRRATGVLDEPATARALAGFLLRGLDCGALDTDEVPFERSMLEKL